MIRRLMVVMGLVGMMAGCWRAETGAAALQGDSMGRWIEELGDANKSAAAKEELLKRGTEAMEPLLAARAGSDAGRVGKVEEVLEVLRARICLRLTREALKLEIAEAEKHVAEYEASAKVPANQKDVEWIELRRKEWREWADTCKGEAARFEKMKESEFYLLAPMYQEYMRRDGETAGKWEHAEIGDGMAVWRGGPPYTFYGNSRSGPFYTNMGYAAPVSAEHFGAAVYVLVSYGRTPHAFGGGYVYVEGHEYPAHASAEQRVDELRAMGRYSAWTVAAEELAAMVQKDPSTKAMLRAKALPAMEETLKRQLTEAERRAVTEAIRAIKN